MKTEEFMRSVSAIDEEMIADSFDYIQKCRKRRKARARTRILLAAAAFALIAASLFTFFALRKNEPEPVEPAATVYFDSGIGVTLRLSEEGKVLDIYADQSDGDEILSFQNVKGKNASEAAREITETLLDNGYLSESDDALLISVDCANESSYGFAGQLQKEAGAVLNAFLPAATVLTQSYNSTATIYADRVSEIAQKYSITPGKAEFVLRLMSILGEKNESKFASMNTREIADLCRKNGISHNIVVRIDSVEMYEIVKNDLGVDSAPISQYKFCAIDEEGIPVWVCCTRSRSETLVYYINSESGKIVDKIAFSEASKEQAELIALRYFSIRKSTVLHISSWLYASKCEYHVRIVTEDRTYQAIVESASGVVWEEK